MTDDTRARFIEATSLLVARNGYHGTSLSEILEASGAPRGSLYHHFPGGKEELVLEATRLGIAWADESFERCLAPGTHPADGLVAFFEELHAFVDEHDYAVGCPVAPIVLDGAPATPALQALCQEALARWESVIRRSLTRAGLTRARAASLAALVLAAEEGALLMARAERRARPLKRISRELEALVRGAVDGP